MKLSSSNILTDIVLGTTQSSGGVETHHVVTGGVNTDTTEVEEDAKYGVILYSDDAFATTPTRIVDVKLDFYVFGIAIGTSNTAGDDGTFNMYAVGLGFDGMSVRFGC